MPRDTEHLTLVYACSGCSSAAQLANHLAVRLDREGDAEMSCIAGIGGRVPSLVRKLEAAARRGRPILAIDGCALSCVKASLAQHQIKATHHIQLGQQGVSKTYHADFDEAQASALLTQVKAQVHTMNERHGSLEADQLQGPHPSQV